MVPTGTVGTNWNRCWTRSTNPLGCSRSGGRGNCFQQLGGSPRFLPLLFSLPLFLSGNLGCRSHNHRTHTYEIPGRRRRGRGSSRCWRWYPRWGSDRWRPRRGATIRGGKWSDIGISRTSGGRGDRSIALHCSRNGSRRWGMQLMRHNNWRKGYMWTFRWGGDWSPM